MPSPADEARRVQLATFFLRGWWTYVKGSLWPDENEPRVKSIRILVPSVVAIDRSAANSGRVARALFALPLATLEAEATRRRETHAAAVTAYQTTARQTGDASGRAPDDPLAALRDLIGSGLWEVVKPFLPVAAVAAGLLILWAMAKD